MAKISIKLTALAIIATSLAALITISSCVNSASTLVNSEAVKNVLPVFPSAVDVTEMQIDQDAQISGRPDITKISRIKGKSGILGYSVESKVLSKSGPFKICVLLDKKLYVKQATVISYPWDRGRDVRKRTFTDQFTGKGPKDPIQLDKDIDAMTGATISSRVMAEGVRDIIRLLKKRT